MTWIIDWIVFLSVQMLVLLIDMMTSNL